MLVKYCKLPWQNRLLKEFCPITCGLCKSKTTNSPTNIPSSVPTDLPTDAPTNPLTKVPTQAPTPVVSTDNGTCIDDLDYRYKGVKKCKWVVDKTEERCNINAKLGDERLISDLCPLTCNKCEPTDIPTNTPTNAPTQAPTLVISTDNGKCMDDLDYRYHGKKCDWVVKNIEKRCDFNAKLGDKQLISDLCQITCNKCEPTDATTNPPTNAPTQAPTPIISTAEGTCMDDLSYRYQGKKKCKWMGKNIEKRCNINAQLGNEKLIREFCRITCGLCEPKTTHTSTNMPPNPPTNAPTNTATNPPTNAPTNAPTQAPTPVISSDNVNCMDNLDYRYKGVKKCKWAGKNIEKRCNINAQLDIEKLISDLCPLTCNKCEPTNDNDNNTDYDSSSSCASNESIFRLQLLL